MKILLSISQQSNLIKEMKTSNNEDIQSFSEYPTNIRDNHLQNLKKRTQQKYISIGCESSHETINWCTVASHKEYINLEGIICSNISQPTNIYPPTSNPQNIPYISHTHFLTDVPPFNLIYNMPERSCWIITIVHNIRANHALKAYILNNLNDSKIEKALKFVLDIDKEPISRSIHYQIAYLYGYGEDLWNKIGCETIFLESLLKGKNYTQTQWGAYSPNSILSYRETVDIGENYKYAVCIIAGLPGLPYFYIYPSFLSPNTEYFKVSELFKTDYDDLSDITTSKCQSEVILYYDFEFLIFNLEELHNFSNKSSIVKGVTIEKDIYINIRGTKRKQKYSLTGVSFREYGKQYAHSRSVIKINNTWYDTDYETIKYQNKYTQRCFKLPERLDMSFNMYLNEITLNYLSFDNSYLFVCLLFYEKVNN